MSYVYRLEDWILLTGQFSLNFYRYNLTSMKAHQDLAVEKPDKMIRQFTWKLCTVQNSQKISWKKLKDEYYLTLD